MYKKLLKGTTGHRILNTDGEYCPSHEEVVCCALNTNHLKIKLNNTTSDQTWLLIGALVHMGWRKKDTLGIFSQNSQKMLKSYRCSNKAKGSVLFVSRLNSFFCVNSLLLFNAFPVSEFARHNPPTYWGPVWIFQFLAKYFKPLRHRQAKVTGSWHCQLQPAHKWGKLIQNVNLTWSKTVWIFFEVWILPNVQQVYFWVKKEVALCLTSKHLINIPVAP